MRRACTGLWSLLLAVALAGVAPAEILPLLNYQAILTDTTGTPLPDGNYSVTFRIWDPETDGAKLWEEGRLITVKDGLLNVLLGSIVSIPDSCFETPDTWLGIQVGLDDEMEPRTRLVSVPYAWYAHDADTAEVAVHSLDKTTDASQLVTGVLDTARYSAYEDLVSEDRIGDQAGQVATGDHVHPQSKLAIFQHGIADSATVNPSAGEIIVGSVEIPTSGSVAYLRIEALCLKTTNGPNVEIRMRLNGSTVYSIGVTGEGYAIVGTTIMHDSLSDLWLSLPDYSNFWCPISLATEGLMSPITAEITAENSGAVPCVVHSVRWVAQFIDE